MRMNRTEISFADMLRTKTAEAKNRIYEEWLNANKETLDKMLSKMIKEADKGQSSITFIKDILDGEIALYSRWACENRLSFAKSQIPDSSKYDPFSGKSMSRYQLCFGWYSMK